LDDREIANGDDLQAALGTHQPGDEVTLVVNRNGREISLRVTLGTAPVVQ